MSAIAINNEKKKELRTETQIFFCLRFTDVAAEKTEKALIAGIEHFDPSKLKHTETQEKNPLPDKEGIYFTKTKLLLVLCCVLAFVFYNFLLHGFFLHDYIAVQQEKTHQNLLNGVEHFDKSSMKHTTTAEKVVLPDSKGMHAYYRMT